METIQHQIGVMQEEIKRLREELEEVKKGSFNNITCRSWQLVDLNGKARIAAGTSAEGYSGMAWFDKDAKLRITVSTGADGEASARWMDKDGNLRIDAVTLTNGTAGVGWLNKDEKLRIAAFTHADGTVYLPTRDLT